jgi:hypothetical protein
MVHAAEYSSAVAHSNRAYFRVVSDSMTLAEITGRVGEKPSSGWSRGDRVLRGNRGVERVMTFTSWFLDSPGGSDLPIHAQIDALYQPVSKISTALRENTELRSTLQIVQYFSASTGNGFHFSPEWISLLATMGAAVDVDQYE